MTRYPAAAACCLDIRRAFHRPWEANAEGTGFDAACRRRVAESPTYPPLLETAIYILQSLGVVILVCNHGKHRSLSLAYDVASLTGGVLVATRDAESPQRLGPVDYFIKVVEAFLEPFSEIFAGWPHPIRQVVVAVDSWDGTAWAAEQPPAAGRDHYLTFARGELLVLLTERSSDACGWAYGLRVTQGGHRSPGWLPPRYVGSIPEDFFPGAPNAFAELTALRPWS